METSINIYQHISPLLSSMEDSIESFDVQKHDFISELPDALLHQIFSFLDMRCVVQTSILGKRWRYLWTCLPFLSFDEDEYNRSLAAVGEGEQKPDNKNFYEEEYNRSLAAFGEGELKPDYKIFTDFLNRILRLRNGSNLSIQSFCLCGDQDYVRMHAMACEFPIYFGRSKEISEFRALNLSKCFYTQLDHYVGLPCLKVLHLKSVFLVGGENIENFFKGCLVLETLIILDCVVVMQTDKLNISAPQLKYLELGNLTTGKDQFDVFNYDIYLKVTVSAPNLTSFKCTDLVSVDYSLVNVSSVVEADIDVKFSMRSFFSGTNEKDSQIVIECLVGLCNVRSLRLSAWLLEVVYEVYKARMKSLVTPFFNLRVLKLKASLSTSEYHAITNFFEICPNVETLVLEITKPPNRRTIVQLAEMFMESPEQEKSMEKDACLEALSSECNFSFHHLKFVEMQNAIGSLNELEFLKFLLKNATILETMTIYFSKTALLDHEMRISFSEELVTFSGSISAGVDISII